MKILVATDGSSFTRKALDYLVRQRKMFVDGNDLVIVNVCAGIPGRVTHHIGSDVVKSYYAEEAAKVIEPIQALFAEHGISNYTTDLRQGRAAEEILRAAREQGADLIVMGTHGHGMLKRALMGSIATKVIAESEIAVLLVQ